VACATGHHRPLARYKFGVAENYLLSRIFLGMSLSTTSASAIPEQASDSTTQTVLQAGKMTFIYWINNLTPQELSRQIRSSLVDATLLPDELIQLWSTLRRGDGSFDFRQHFLECETNFVYSRISRKHHSRALLPSEFVQWLLILSKTGFRLRGCKYVVKCGALDARLCRRADIALPRWPT